MVVWAACTDGSSFGKPGPAGAGIAAFRNDTCIFSYCVSLGIASNNVAELEGLSAACDHALRGPGHGGPDPRPRQALLTLSEPVSGALLVGLA